MPLTDFGLTVLRPYLLGLLVVLPIMFLAWRMYQPPLKPSRRFNWKIMTRALSCPRKPFD